MMRDTFSVSKRVGLKSPRFKLLSVRYGIRPQADRDIMIYAKKETGTSSAI